MQLDSNGSNEDNTYLSDNDNLFSYVQNHKAMIKTPSNHSLEDVGDHTYEIDECQPETSEQNKSNMRNVGENLSKNAKEVNIKHLNNEYNEELKQKDNEKMQQNQKTKKQQQINQKKQINKQEQTKIIQDEIEQKQNDLKQKQKQKQEIEQRYNKQLLNDMKQMQKNMKNTKNRSNNNNKRNNNNNNKHQRLNTTYTYQQTSQNIKKQEIKMMIKISLQKKKQNYQQLKQWDKNRAQNLALHHHMIQLLQIEIDKRIKSSFDNLEILTTFFKDKIKQQQKYYTTHIINTKQSLINNSISKNVYINCSVILNTLYENNDIKCKKIQDFVKLIKYNILRDLIYSHSTGSQKQLLRIRQKISTLKLSLKQYNCQTQHKTSQLAKFVNLQTTTLKKSNGDFYEVQLEFLNSAAQQFLIQKKLGQYCLQYYETALREQLIRTKVIREALVTYHKGLKQTYHIDIEDNEMQQLSKGEQQKLINEFYSLEQIFDQRILKMFREYEKLQPQKDITIKMFKKYISNFKYNNFNNRLIILKSFNLNYLYKGKINQQYQYQFCYIVITVDNYLHLFFNKRSQNQQQNIYHRPSVTIKICQKQLQIKSINSNLIVDLIKKQQHRKSMINYFWENKSNHTYRLKFNKLDNKQQFIDYINRLIL